MAAMHLAATLDLPNGFLNLLNNALEDLDLEPDTRAHYQQLRDAPDTVQRGIAFLALSDIWVH